MADHSTIEWTQASWNFIDGCTRISDGCDHCYIERTPPFRMAHRHFDKPGIGGTTGVRLHSDKLGLPMKWRKPRRIFTNSLGDLFHEAVPDQFIAEAFAVMVLAPQHTYQVLTKRHARMRSLLGGAKTNGFLHLIADAILARGYRTSFAWPLPQVWLGVSVENQQWADIRIPALLDTPAAVRWLSCEPLLGAVDLAAHLDRMEHKGSEHSADVGGIDWYGPRIGWVVAGGESGPGARPMHPAWARTLRDQCASAGVPYFFKQWGEHVTVDQMTVDTFRAWDAAHGSDVYRDDVQWQVGKKAAGRVLDGRTHDEYPTTAAVAR